MRWWPHLHFRSHMWQPLFHLRDLFETTETVFLHLVQVYNFCGVVFRDSLITDWLVGPVLPLRIFLSFSWFISTSSWLGRYKEQFPNIRKIWNQNAFIIFLPPPPSKKKQGKMFDPNVWWKKRRLDKKASTFPPHHPPSGQMIIRFHPLSLKKKRRGFLPFPQPNFTLHHSWRTPKNSLVFFGSKKPASMIQLSITPVGATTKIGHSYRRVSTPTRGDIFGSSGNKPQGCWFLSKKMGMDDVNRNVPI